MKSYRDLFFLTFAFLTFLAVKVSADETTHFRYVLGRGCLNSLGQNGYNENYFGECGRIVDGNFYGQNLKGKRLRGAALIAANFGKADLTGADLRGADLTDANIFQRANFTGALIDQWTRLSISTDDAKKMGMVLFDASMANRTLLDALGEGSLSGVLSAIDNLADLTQNGNVLEYALTRSTDSSNPDIIRILLENGTDPNVQGQDRPLNLALSCLKKKGSHSDQLVDQDKDRCLNAIGLLLQYGADPFDQNRSSSFWSALLRRRDRSDLGLDAYMLLKNYGKVTERILKTPLDFQPCYGIPTWVVRNGRLLSALVEDGAPLFPVSGCTSDNSKETFRSPLTAFFQDFNYYLMRNNSDDSVSGTVDLWKAYAKLGFDLFEPIDSSKPETAFIYSVLKGWTLTPGMNQNPRVQVFKLLKQLGYDLRATKAGTDWSHVLAGPGYDFNGSNWLLQMSEFSFLKEEGINFSEKDANGDTPLITLARRNTTKWKGSDWFSYSLQIAAFVNLNLDWNVRSDSDGETPLCLLVQRYDEGYSGTMRADLIMNEILKKADKNFTNKNGKYPIEYCQSKRCKDLLK
jgi:ankyrin repeat protein